MQIPITRVSPPPDAPFASRTSTSPSAPAPSVSAGPTRPTAASSGSQSPGIDAAKQVASQINEFLRSSASDIQFSIDGDSSDLVVRIVDSQTQEVIRQIPSEDMLAISRSLTQMTGVLLNQKA